jgi:hypothetical protein
MFRAWPGNREKNGPGDRVPLRLKDEPAWLNDEQAPDVT